MIATDSRLTHLPLSTLVLLALALLAPAPPAEVTDNWQRLQDLPLELRTQLADQLKEFDGLDRGEKQAVRTLDQKIAAEPDYKQKSYYAVLQRYHAWVRGLNETQRNELYATPPANRLALVNKILDDRKTKSSERPDPSIFHYADFGGISPFDQAERIKLWMLLSDAEKAEFTKLDAVERPKRMSRLIREKAIQIKRPAPAQLEALYKRALDSGRYPFLKKAAESKDAKKQANLKHRFVDNYWFVDQPPKKVSPDKLLQFERALPGWVRSEFDMLPPDEARRRLAILYRLIYPNEEMGGSPARPLTKTRVPPASAAPASSPPLAVPKAY